VFQSGRCTIPAEDDVPVVLDALAERSGRTITVTPIVDLPKPATAWVDTVASPEQEQLSISSFAVALDRSVHRWSFSAITSRTEAGPGGHDPFDPTGADRGADDEDEPAEPGVSDDDRAPAAVGADAGGPLARLRAGTQFGTFVHAVLERVDFAAADLDGAIADAVRTELTTSGADPSLLAPAGADGTDLLAAGLRAAIETPLGPLFGSARLADLGRRHRLDELAFDMRIGEAGRHPTVSDIGSLVAASLPGGHPLVPWATALADGVIDVRLAGYLTGSIDLVARVATESGDSRFVVADYKTNRLTPWGADPGPHDYDIGHMVDAMSEHHYPLQALLYAVALQRYLRSRTRPGGPTGQVVGATYLFLRGMTGREVAHDGVHPHGVFTWELDPGLIASVSDLLDGRVTGGAS
jgi:exodeoxyribonuclease V beta subunit